MHCLFDDTRCAHRLLIGLLVGLMATAIGCERDPEDLEEWRNARGGTSQLAEWAADDGEPMDVRIRAVQILIEEGESDRLPRTFEEMESPEIRQAIADGAVPTVEQMWAVQDFPELTDELREEGGQIAPDGVEAIRAVDAIYRLDDHVSDDVRPRLQEIIADWISADWEARTQWASTSIPLLAPLAGDDAGELVSGWVLVAHDPREVSSSLRRHLDEEQHGPIDAAVGERAEEEHPNLSREMMHAVDGATTDEISPYLRTAIFDDETPNEFRQVAIDTLADVGSERAVEILRRVVERHRAPLRWAGANALIDARGTTGLVDIAQSLPTDIEEYAADRGDDLHRSVRQICNYVNTNIERGDIDADDDAIAELLQMDHWPAQVIGLQCVGRMEIADLRDAVEALTDEDFSIPAWEDEATIGEFATDVEALLEQ